MHISICTHKYRHTYFPYVRERERKILTRCLLVSFQVHSYSVRIWFRLYNINTSMLWTGYQRGTEGKYFILLFWCLCLSSNWRHWRNQMLSGFVYAATSSDCTLVPTWDCTSGVYFQECIVHTTLSWSSLESPWIPPDVFSVQWGAASRFAKRHVQSLAWTSAELASSE
jgi:hypothetical protein